MLLRYVVRPRSVIAVLHNSHNQQPARVIAKDISNVKQRLRADALAGRTPIQALVQEFQVEDFVYAYKTDSIGHITRLFFAAHTSLSLFSRYPEVILLDCTYNTNRFHMPLLTLIGISGVDKSFYVAFASLKSDKEEDFSWAP